MRYLLVSIGGRHLQKIYKNHLKTPIPTKLNTNIHLADVLPGVPLLRQRYDEGVPLPLLLLVLHQLGPGVSRAS